MSDEIKIAFGEDGKARMLNDEYCIYCADERTFNNVKSATSRILQAKKPVEKDIGFGDKALSCPTCGKPVTNYWSPGTQPVHCQFCGQLLDWVKDKEPLSDYQQQIKKTIDYCCRRADTPDLHSFTAKVKGGSVAVDCLKNGVHMAIFLYDEKGERNHAWSGTKDDAIVKLAELQIDMESIEI